MEEKLTKNEAYKAMFNFLEAYWERGSKMDEQIAILLGAMRLTDDGKPMDPAYTKDWEDAIEKMLSNKNVS